MPIFEYRCKDCAHVFEKYRSACGAAQERQTCPSCGGERIEKVLSLFGSSVRAEGGSSCQGGGFRGFS